MKQRKQHAIAKLKNTVVGELQIIILLIRETKQHSTTD